MDRLRDALRRGDSLVGSWLTIAHPTIAEVMAGAGFDFLVVDMEHSPLDQGDCETLLRVIGASEATPLVRVGANDPLPIKRALDSGAAGVIVPMVNSADDARRAVSSACYPPKGTRGVGIARAQGFGPGFDDYVERMAAGPVVVAQIEHIDAVGSLEEILAVEGIDATLVGPYDLSGSLGHPGEFDHPDVAHALERYEEVSRHAGVPMGYHQVRADLAAARSRLDRGYALVAVGIDFWLLGDAARDVTATLRD